MTEPQDPVENESRSAPLLDRTFNSQRGGFHLRVMDDGRIYLRAFGKGSVENAHAGVAYMEEVFYTVPKMTFEALGDLRELSGSPIRVQFILGKWLRRRREHFTRGAIYGASPWERRLASAALVIARMTDVVRFTRTEAEARAFLGWTD